MINIAELLTDLPVVAILRAPTADRFVQVAEICVQQGIRAVEFTMTSAGALEAVGQARQRLGSEVLIGVGSLRQPDQVEAALDAGADFCVAQVFRPALVDVAHRRGTPFIPGALTPNEILTAWEYGVQAVKVSPIGPVGGVGYLAETHAPMPDVALMPTGGVALADVPRYLQAGAAVVGVSRFLLGDALSPDGDLAALATRAGELVSSLG